MKKWWLVAAAIALVAVLGLYAHGQPGPKPSPHKKARELTPREKSIRMARLILLVRWYLAEGDKEKAAKAYEELKELYTDARQGKVVQEKYRTDMIETWEFARRTIYPILEQVRLGKDPKKLIAAFGKPGLEELRARLARLLRDYEDKLVVYVNVVDIADGKPYKWRVTEYLIAQTFELANPRNKDKIKDRLRKSYAKRKEWKEYSKKKKEKFLEDKYKLLRKEKGVSKLNYTHIKALQYEPEPKPKKGLKKTGKSDNAKGTAEPREPKAAYWVDPRDLADYLILGKVSFKAGKKSIYFGETVACSSIGELEIRVVRRVDGKVIKKFKPPRMKRSYTIDGQDGAHRRCMRELGPSVASKIVKLTIFKKKK